ncbi:hypothetical protein CPB86DRAFT_57876 [Serendipita vermifera]|nr:hypothetical protein CPB86DRAFT_57876 [Serendipita vermifera]
MRVSNFSDLNFSQLQELQLRRLQWDQSRQIMDLALQSSCNKMTLDINYDSHSLELFQHELMQRVVNIGIVTDAFMGYLFDESPGLKELLFPNIETWRLEGENELLRSLDLSGAKKVDFRSIDYPFRPIMANLPDDLTTLNLACVVFTLNSLSCGQRQCLPCLTSLILEDVIFIGPFRKYFHCPRLRYLSYVVSPDVRGNENIVEGRKKYYKTPIRETFDDTFFRDSSGLFTLFLGGTTMDTALVRTLAGCPMLHTLRMQDCLIVDFIHPFMEQLEDITKFPSLKLLSIDNSWPGEIYISYEEFTAKCSSKRPHLDITGNNQQEFVKTPPEDAALQFDLDGMDEDSMDEDSMDEEDYIGGEWSLW